MASSVVDSVSGELIGWSECQLTIFFTGQSLVDCLARDLKHSSGEHYDNDNG